MYKVLLIEDDRFLQKAIADKFEKEDFELFIAGDGKIGVAQALEQKPDFILLDLIMPVMDGEAALKALKQMPETKDIPVAILTAVPAGIPQYFKDEKLLEQVVGYWEKDQNSLRNIVGKIKKILEEKAGGR